MSSSLELSSEVRSSLQTDLTSGLASTQLISGTRTSEYRAEYSTREYDSTDRHIEPSGIKSPVLSELDFNEGDRDLSERIVSPLDYTAKEKLLERYGEKHTKERSSSRTSRRVKLYDENEKFDYSHFATIPPTAAKSPVINRKTTYDRRSPSPSPLDPRTPSPIHTLNIPSRDVRTPKIVIEEAEHHCKYHSHHLDHEYCPPPSKGLCAACKQNIIGKLLRAMGDIYHPECFTCSNCDTALNEANFKPYGNKPYCVPCYEKLFGPPCNVCKKPTQDNRYNLINRIWHPECFCCVECGKRLTPDNFIERMGSPYCKDDYHKLFSPKCCVCNLPIRDKAINALNKMWHTHCFTCTSCSLPLEERNFYERKGQPYCEKCHSSMFDPKCVKCRLPITGGRQITVNGKPWHPECFTCTVCVTPLSPNNYREYQGKPYCDDDYHKLFSPKCKACTLPITENPVNAMGSQWHPRCFNCTNCAKQLSPNNFYEKKGKPYCEDCHHKLFSPKCAGCHLPITDGKIIRALGKDWHPQCFQCTQCAIPLNPNNFYEKNGKPYCENDYHKLFSPKCAGCKLPITEGVPVNAMGKQWHPLCFVCTECAKPLGPNNFYERNGKPYCEDDYHRLFSPKCAGCRQPIKDGNFIRALGKDWHPLCFKCTTCAIPLSPDNFYEKNGKPYCENDYHNLFSPKCGGCLLPIKDGNFVSAMGKQWHPLCFKCAACAKPLTPPHFFEKNGKPYCEHDYHRLFAPPCAGCSLPITDPSTMVKAMGKNWHPQCFHCHECHRPLTPNNFFEKNGKPYCEDDYHKLFSPKCSECNLPIKGTPLVAMGRQWHPNCFKCYQCGIPLSPNNFKEKDGKPYCNKHFQEMFLPKCYGCKLPITDRALNALGHTWHPECFCCAVCRKPLAEDGYREKDGLAYCDYDYHALFSPKCAACAAPIREKCLTAMRRTWHPEHFLCQHCNKQLSEDPEGYHEHDDKSYCRPCYIELFAPYCRACNKPIVEKICVTALDGKWHPDCFVCRDCHCPLKTGNYFEFEGEPYCEDHYRCKMCPDCVKLRRAQNKYFGQSPEIKLGA